MAFVVGKTIGGRTYYYLRKSQRVDGKVKAITVAYLGKDKNVAEQKAKTFGKDRLQHATDTVKKGNAPVKKMTKDSEKKQGNEGKDFVSFVQEAGLIWGPEPELYGGLAGFYTYGPLGKLLKNKVENSVRQVFNRFGFRELEGPTVLPDVVWKASGHLGTFADRIVRCSNCDNVYRADKLIEEHHDVAADAFSDEQLLGYFNKEGIACPNCKGVFHDKIERQSLMMKTNVAGTEASLRPETATVTYLPFPRLQQYFRKKLPFAVYQIGKAYRNEISPRQSVLRGREFTQAEGQLFIDPLEKNHWDKYDAIKNDKLPFWTWQDQAKHAMHGFLTVAEALEKGLVKSQAYAWCLWLAYQQFVHFGVPIDCIRLRQHAPDEKAFYADDAWDVELNLNNYGWTEVCGVHDRTDYDLTQHAKESGTVLEATRENGEKFVPHILEIAFGTDRPTYALIDLFYDKKAEDEGKTMLRVPYHIAPIDVSVFPLMKKPELLEFSENVRDVLGQAFIVDYDISGSIGRRYVRSAAAGTPFAVTIDYDSLENEDVTVRDRDSEKQIRVKVADLRQKLARLLAGEEKI